MSNIINMYTRKKIIQLHDEWAEIGVHLEASVDGGMPKDEALNTLAVEGVDPLKVDLYVKRHGWKVEGRMEEVEDLYTPEENTIIRRWILGSPYKPDSRDNACERSNRVAEIVLFRVRTELPQWAQVFHDGRMNFGREHQIRAIKKRDGLLHPHFLFQINWADSGPGISWPEEYRLTLLPGYNIYVLTASQDSTDVHGYTDLALDYIPAIKGDYLPLKQALCSITHWWESQRDGWCQSPWESLVAPGGFNPLKLLALRDEIWAEWEM